MQGTTAHAHPDLLGHVRVDRQVLERFPGFRLSVVFALGLQNGAGTPHSREQLQVAAGRGIARLQGRAPKEFPTLGNWRAAYSAFGAKPSAYPCSAEALLQRALRNGPQAVPSINVLVDLYNAVSLEHLLPVGGEDLDRIAGSCQLRVAAAADCRAEGEDAANAPYPGEVIWADELGWTCRRWNWRQGARTRLTESTRNAFFLIEGMASASYEPEMKAAASDLCERIRGTLQPGRLEVAHIVGPTGR